MSASLSLIAFSKLIFSFAYFFLVRRCQRRVVSTVRRMRLLERLVRLLRRGWCRRIRQAPVHGLRLIILLRHRGGQVLQRKGDGDGLLQEVDEARMRVRAQRLRGRGCGPRLRVAARQCSGRPPMGQRTSGLHAQAAPTAVKSFLPTVKSSSFLAFQDEHLPIRLAFGLN